MPKTRKIKLFIVFDSNIIYNSGPSYLINKPTNELIERFKKIVDVNISFYLPEIVIFERTFQQKKEIEKLLPNVKKIENIFALNFQLNNEFIDSQIDKIVEQQIGKNNLKVIKLDYSKIKWEDLIQKACSRKPPFEEGEKEKGFKDALILECLLQVIDQSPTTPSICRILFVSNDDLLMKATKERTVQNRNVEIFSSLTDLENYVNILSTSEINENIIKAISEKVKLLFFTKDDTSTIYYSAKISDKIVKDYSTELSELPADGEKRIVKKWIIGQPVFIKKIGQKVFWRTEISADTDVLKSFIIHQSTETRPSLSASGLMGFPSSTSDLKTSGLFGTGSSLRTMMSTETKTLETPTSRKLEVVQKGLSKFEVNWITTVSVTHKVRFLKVENITFLETIWEPF